MDIVHINKLRKANEIPFKIVSWLEELHPIVDHDDVGTLYKGNILAEDEYGKYAAIVGTTDQFLKNPLEVTSDGTQYKILKIEKVW